MGDRSGTPSLYVREQYFGKNGDDSSSGSGLSENSLRMALSHPLANSAQVLALTEIIVLLQYAPPSSSHFCIYIYYIVYSHKWFSSCSLSAS